MTTQTIINADCLEYMKTLPDKSFDLVLTDIPYDAVNRETNGLRNLDKGDADILTVSLEELMKEIIRVCKGSIYIFCGFEQISPICNELKLDSINPRLIIWEKTNPSPMNGEVTWLSGIEPCVFGKKPNATYNGHCKNTVLRFPSGESKMHPTQKPIELFKTLLATSTNEEDKVLDPFLGSGTTALACKHLNRNCVGIEISEKYCKIAQERLDSTPTPMF